VKIETKHWRFSADGMRGTYNRALLICIIGLGAFAEVQKATVNFVMSARPLAWNNLRIFRKSVKKIQVPLKSDQKKVGNLMKTNVYFLSYLAHFF